MRAIIRITPWIYFENTKRTDFIIPQKRIRYV